MKIMLMAILAMLTITACDSDDDEFVEVTELPAAAQTFLSQYFPGLTVKSVEKEKASGTFYYDVTLADGTEVEFDQAGAWTDVDCKNKAVPSVIIPQAISAYVEANYPGLLIVQIERESYGYDIELSNDLDIRFDTLFNVTRVGD